MGRRRLRWRRTERLVRRAIGRAAERGGRRWLRGDLYDRPIGRWR